MLRLERGVAARREGSRVSLMGDIFRGFVGSWA